MAEIPAGYSARPLNEDDFQFQYDGDHEYYFFENENGDLFAYGHVDIDRFADDASKYWQYVSGDDSIEVDGSQVEHVYAVGLEPEGDLLFVSASAKDPFARPISILRS